MFRPWETYGPYLYFKTNQTAQFFRDHIKSRVSALCGPFFLAQELGCPVITEEYVFGVSYEKRFSDERADEHNATNRKVRVLLIRVDVLERMGKPQSASRAQSLRRGRRELPHGSTSNLYFQNRFNDLVRLKTLYTDWRANGDKSIALVGTVYITVPSWGAADQKPASYQITAEKIHATTIKIHDTELPTTEEASGRKTRSRTKDSSR
jgi:hypothetical protein